jgi:hypothetical protein
MHAGLHLRPVAAGVFAVLVARFSIDYRTVVQTRLSCHAGCATRTSLAPTSKLRRMNRSVLAA